MDSPATSLVVKVTCGTEALERLNQGFTVAATALASGVEVSLWLTGDGWRVPPCRKPPASQFPTIAAALAAVAETGDVE